MIRDDLEYKLAVARLEQQRRQVTEQRDLLEQAGFSEEHIEQVVRHMKSSCRQLEEDVATYESRTAPTWRPSDWIMSGASQSTS